MSVCITGWAHNKFGVNLGQSSENMIADVVDKAIKHAEISVKDMMQFLLERLIMVSKNKTFMEPYRLLLN